MLREHNKILVQFQKILDIGLTAISFIIAYFIKTYLLEPFGGMNPEPNYYVIGLMIIVTWYITFNLCNLYESYRETYQKDLEEGLRRWMADEPVGEYV